MRCLTSSARLALVRTSLRGSCSCWCRSTSPRSCDSLYHVPCWSAANGCDSADAVSIKLGARQRLRPRANRSARRHHLARRDVGIYVAATSTTNASLVCSSANSKHRTFPSVPCESRVAGCLPRGRRAVRRRCRPARRCLRGRFPWRGHHRRWCRPRGGSAAPRGDGHGAGPLGDAYGAGSRSEGATCSGAVCAARRCLRGVHRSENRADLFTNALPSPVIFSHLDAIRQGAPFPGL